ADLLGVHGLVGLEIVQRPAGAPRPGTQRAPVVGHARLALVVQTDDPARQAAAVVGLDAVGNDDCVPPAFAEHLVLPGCTAAAGGWAEPTPAEAELHDDRHRPLHVGRRR